MPDMFIQRKTSSGCSSDYSAHCQYFQWQLSRGKNVRLNPIDYNSRTSSGIDFLRVS